MVFSKIFNNQRNFRKDGVFILLFIVIAYFYYNSFIHEGPLNAHLWRQADSLSLTRNYAEGANFFHPEMDNLLGDDSTTGKTAGEFPILYYTVGIIWKVMGESYYSYRMFYLLILFAGLFCLYKSLNIILKDSYWSIAISLLLFTSPAFVFYGVSFLTDAPSFSFVLIALYFFTRYAKDKRLALFYFAMLFFALGGLVKISSLIAFLLLFGVFVVESISSIKSLENSKLFNGNKFEWIGFGAVFISIISWYYYANAYNELHGFKYTFNDIFPIWLIEEGKGEAIIKGVKSFTSQAFFSKPVLFSLLFIGIINLFLRKRISLFPYLANIITIVGGFIYVVLWAPLLGNHDYYFMALLIIFVGILIPFIWYIKTNYTDIFTGRITKIFLGVFLLFNIMYCSDVIRLKTVAEDVKKEGNFVLVGNHDLVVKMLWINWDVRSNWKRFEEMRPFIRELGITKEDKVISLPDGSFNISLFLLGQKGWTAYRPINNVEDLNMLIDKGAKYLFISKDDMLSKEHIVPFLTEKIGEYKGVKIFKLSKRNPVEKQDQG